MQYLQGNSVIERNQRSHSSNQATNDRGGSKTTRILHRLAISVGRLKLCMYVLQSTATCVHVYHKDKSPWTWSVSLLISHDGREAYPWEVHIINTCSKLSLMLPHMIFDHSARTTINSQFIFQMHRPQSVEAPQSDAAFLMRAFFFCFFFPL